MTATLIVAAMVALAWTLLAARLLGRRAAFRFLGPTPEPFSASEAPSIAAVVPARNEEAHVAATVAALRNQEYPRLAITVVDDQSTDDTAGVVARLVDTSGPGEAPLRLI